MKKLILFLIFAFLFLSSTAFADIRTESDALKKDLISFHNKMVNYLGEAAWPSDTLSNTLTTEQAGELFIYYFISRAYLNYALFLKDEVEWLTLDLGNESVMRYLKTRFSEFNKEGESYDGLLALHIKIAKNLEMTRKLQLLKEEIASLHVKIKKFSDEYIITTKEPFDAAKIIFDALINSTETSKKQ